MQTNQSRGIVGEAVETVSLFWLLGIAAGVVGGAIALADSGMEIVPGWVRYTAFALYLVGFIGMLKKGHSKGFKAALIMLAATLFTLGLSNAMDGGQQDPLSNTLHGLSNMIAIVFPLLGGSIAALAPQVAGDPKKHV